MADAKTELSKVRADKAKEVEDKILAVHDAATAEDKAAVAELIKRAQGATKDVAKVTVTPGMAAILFWEHNKQNRAWSYAAALKNAKEIIEGEWQWHNQGFGFLTSGDIGDGQHRLSGIALAGKAVEMPIIFGLEAKAIEVIDTGNRRQAWQALEILQHVEDPRMKQQVIKPAYSYLAQYYGQFGDLRTKQKYILTNNREVNAAIREHDKLLTECIEIGKDSLKGLSAPRALSVKEAAALAFLLRTVSPTVWTAEVVRDYLIEFQIGQDKEGGRSPLFVASDILTKDAQKRERVAMTGKFGAAIKAFTLHKKGITGVRVGDIRAAMKPKHLPDPSDVNDLAA
jgi:predicted metal-dependent hydrolase